MASESKGHKDPKDPKDRKVQMASQENRRTSRGLQAARAREAGKDLVAIGDPQDQLDRGDRLEIRAYRPPTVLRIAESKRSLLLPFPIHIVLMDRRTGNRNQLCCFPVLNGTVLQIRAQF